MADLALEKIRKSFGVKRPVAAVRDLSLTIRSGECVALLGPSGAGKSTVLRLIAGLELVDSGRILIGGEAVESVAPARRGIGMAFQFPALLPQLTAGENLQLGGRLRGLKGPKVDHIAASLGITPLLSRMPETLSGGEQQRVALGRALLAAPRVLLLDEPLASLDPLTRIELREVIRRVQRELGLTTVYVTHDQAEAAAVADRIALLRNGGLEQFSTAREMYLKPDNLFVARFFGIDGMNCLTARITREGERWFADAGTVRFGLSRPPESLKQIEVIVAFRPSAAILSREARGPWILKEDRDLGWARILRLLHGSAEVEAQLPLDHAVGPGKTFELQVDSGKILLFDPASGRRVL